MLGTLTIKRWFSRNKPQELSIMQRANLDLETQRAKLSQYDTQKVLSYGEKLALSYKFRILESQYRAIASNLDVDILSISEQSMQYFETVVQALPEDVQQLFGTMQQLRNLASEGRNIRDQLKG